MRAVITFIFCAVLAISACSSTVPVSVPGANLKTWNDFKWANIVRQDFDYSCGAAALATLGRGYFNDPLEESFVLQMLIARLSPVEIHERTIYGFSMRDLQGVANALGYEAVGVKLPPEALPVLEGPIIVILRDKGYDLEHFAILKGVDETRAYLADSLRGNIKIPLYTFFKQWTGAALILGRKDFGLPKNHALSIQPSDMAHPEVDIGRQMYLR